MPSSTPRTTTASSRNSNGRPCGRGSADSLAMRGQPYGEGRALPWSGGQFQPAAVRGDDLPGEVQPEPESVGPRAAHDPVEHPRSELSVHPGTLIGYLN